MDVSTVNNAVSDALANLPAGTSSFINDNIGTAAGQQAIYNAGVSLGLSQAQIAAVVSQATGQTVTPQQVAQVAATVAPPAPPPAAPAAPVNAPQFVGTPAPGAVGTNYGQASTAQIANTQQTAPDLATSLQNGTAKMTYDGNGVPYLYNATTGQQISGNYQIQVGQNGQLGINMPSANGSMIQVATKLNQDGSLAPVNASNVLNVGVNQGAGGFGGGVSNLTPIIGAAAAILNPALIPYLAAYNAASAVNKKQYGQALLSAAVSYGGFNPDSQLANLLKNGADVPTDATSGQPLVDSTTAVTPSGTDLSQIGNTGNLGSTDYTLGGTGSNGTGLNVQQGTGTNLFNTGAVNPTTGLVNGIGLQPSGSTNISTMGGAQGLTIPSTTGASTTTNAVTGGSGTTPLGTGNLPINTLTGAPVGTTLNNTNTGVFNGNLTNILSDIKPPVVPPTAATAVTPAAAAAATPAAASLLTPTNVLAGSAILNTLGAANTNKAIANASNTQTQAGQNVQGVLSDLYNQYSTAQQPYQTLGAGALQEITNQAPYLTHQFNAADLQAGLAPNYDFMLAQGQGANRNLANVGGGTLSGNTLQGLNQFTQNYASNAYQNAFNNYQTQRQNIYGNLSNAAGLGQTSLGQLGTVGANLANTYGNVTTGLAASQAGAQTAQAVNTQNTLSNLGQTALLSSLIKPA
jgi:hypothetical protein